MAYFADVILRCGKPDVDRHGYVEGLCKSWARHETWLFSALQRCLHPEVDRVWGAQRTLLQVARGT